MMSKIEEKILKPVRAHKNVSLKIYNKVGVGILVIDFQGNIFMSSDRFQNKFLFNLRRHSTLHDLPFQSYDQRKMSKKVTV